MGGIRYALLPDGPSDRALLQVINWAVRRRNIRVEKFEMVELGFLKNPPKSLADRAISAFEFFPCDVLFIHRDAESSSLEARLAEIKIAIEQSLHRHVPIVPVRMTEAWLLHDESAIRTASGNPNGKVALDLPPPARVEKLSNPKEILKCALLTATELEGRHRKQRERKLHRMILRVAELIDDFSPLLVVNAFQHFLLSLDETLGELFPEDRNE
ncbi:MAG: hypothetical protein ACLFRG_15240 [Desulfococcaceae bacterium]